MRSIYKPPQQLFTLGNTKLLERPAVAIVGSRRPTPYGVEVTRRLARELGQRGVVIVSGLALGVDSLTHRACLEMGGQTIAVLPAGLSQIYPRQHAGLAQQIVEQDGLLVSEHPPNATSVQKHHFLQRNRIIAGLAEMTIIPEAAKRSGSLSTARLALEAGRRVAAVPGPIDSQLSQGTNQLIADGAEPIISISQFLASLGLEQSAIQATNDPLLILLEAQPTPLSSLVGQLNQAPAELTARLTQLELAGRVWHDGTNWHATN